MLLLLADELPPLLLRLEDANALFEGFEKGLLLPGVEKLLEVLAPNIEVAGLAESPEPNTPEAELGANAPLSFFTANGLAGWPIPMAPPELNRFFALPLSIPICDSESASGLLLMASVSEEEGTTGVAGVAGWSKLKLFSTGVEGSAGLVDNEGKLPPKESSDEVIGPPGGLCKRKNKYV